MTQQANAALQQEELPTGQPDKPVQPLTSGQRLAPYHWQKGVSGNPGGRSAAWRECMKAAQQDSLEAMQVLKKLMQSDDERVALLAANSILDRAFGKPKEQKTEDVQQARPDLSCLTSEQLANLRNIMQTLAKATSASSDPQTIDGQATIQPAQDVAST